MRVCTKPQLVEQMFLYISKATCSKNRESVGGATARQKRGLENLGASSCTRLDDGMGCPFWCPENFEIWMRQSTEKLSGVKAHCLLPDSLIYSAHIPNEVPVLLQLIVSVVMTVCCRNNKQFKVVFLQSRRRITVAVREITPAVWFCS